MLDVNVIFDCWVSFNICGCKANHFVFSHMVERFTIISCSFFAIVEVVCTFHWLVVGHHLELPLIWMVTNNATGEGTKIVLG